MSLRDCRDCEQSVSEMAEACPNCGAPHPTESSEVAHRLQRQRRAERGWFEIAIGVIAGLIGFTVLWAIVMLLLGRSMGVPGMM